MANDQFIEVVQGTPEWHALRCGKVTASRIDDVMAKGKGDAESASRRNYRMELVVERRTGIQQEGFVSRDMILGQEREPIARARYEVARGVLVREVSFIDHRSIPMCGASPDGLVGDDGMLELKCPKAATHYGYIMGNKVPADYQLQMLWQMECANRKWVDFGSYCPEFDRDRQLFIRRFYRDDERLKVIREAVVDFERQVSMAAMALDSVLMIDEV